MAVFIGGIGKANDFYNDILQDLKNNKILSYSNEVAGWYAIARDGIFAITFYDKDQTKFYKNAKSWAKRVAQLQTKGF
jgi:hypothetical protein